MYTKSSSDLTTIARLKFWSGGQEGDADFMDVVGGGLSVTEHSPQSS